LSAVELAVARTLTRGDLSHDPLVEAGADRIGALAFASPLGSALWRIKLGHDKANWFLAKELLRKRVRLTPADNRRTLDLVVERALREWFDPRCGTCGGKGHIAHENAVVHVCTSCNGSGLARQSDQGRINAIRVSPEEYSKRWERVFNELHRAIGDAYASAKRTVSNELERGGA